MNREAVADVVLFHHALGLTNPVRSFADALRDAGHTVHTPDLYEGRTFDTIEDGMAYSEEIGGPMAIVDRARVAVEPLPSEVFYVGFSLGVLPAQSLAQTRPGARGAVLFLGLGTGRGGLLLPLLFLLLAQTEASFEFLGPGTGQTRTVTAQRNKTIDQETLGKDLGKAAADGSG